MRMPDAVTLPQAFRNAGYQAFAVGKLHVYPQRNRIGFDEVILQEEGRYEMGTVDDYQIWLGEQGYAGMEFLHGMGNNTYYTRPWHLPENTHPTNWATKEMMKQIKRRDPDKPMFLYLSYQFPHPPLVPLSLYLDMYKDEEIDEPVYGGWIAKAPIFERLEQEEGIYSHKEMIRAKKAFYAQCTHIDQQIRLVIGTLRECGVLDDTVIIFTSDHGDMLFDHHMVSKRTFYDRSANVPLILSGKPVYKKYQKAGVVEKRLLAQADIMPTILEICGICPPEGMDGRSAFSGEERAFIYGEIGEGIKASRMIRDDRFKLIYYPFGNVSQLFDMEQDPRECTDLSDREEYREKKKELEEILIQELYGDDLQWVKNGKLTGIRAVSDVQAPDYGLYNQRGYHWPPPSGYHNLGKNH